jgi:hypothetical protein
VGDGEWYGAGAAKNDLKCDASALIFSTSGDRQNSWQ